MAKKKHAWKRYEIAYLEKGHPNAYDIPNMLTGWYVITISEGSKTGKYAGETKADAAAMKERFENGKKA